MQFNQTTTFEEIFDYLEELRTSGQINMMAAGYYLQSRFDMSPQEAKAILLRWISEPRQVRLVCRAR